jgi:predicted XRE-type DNA-binding protein
MAKRKVKAIKTTPGTGTMNIQSDAPSITIEPSSGNVFADLGLADAAELDTKVRLAVEINRVLDARNLSQVIAAKLLGITQPKVSALKAYKLDGYSVERLMRFLTVLGRDVEIRITAGARRRAPGRISVEAG